LAERFAFPPECVFCGIADHLLHSIRSKWNSAIVPDIPKLFEDFKQNQFTLLWRGSRDGFDAPELHAIRLSAIVYFRFGQTLSCVESVVNLYPQFVQGASIKLDYLDKSPRAANAGKDSDPH
jgi:hypothetical protein